MFYKIEKTKNIEGKKEKIIIDVDNYFNVMEELERIFKEDTLENTTLYIGEGITLSAEDLIIQKTWNEKDVPGLVVAQPFKLDYDARVKQSLQISNSELKEGDIDYLWFGYAPYYNVERDCFLSSGFMVEPGLSYIEAEQKELIHGMLLCYYIDYLDEFGRIGGNIDNEGVILNKDIYTSADIDKFLKKIILDAIDDIYKKGAHHSWKDEYCSEYCSKSWIEKNVSTNDFKISYDRIVEAEVILNDNSEVYPRQHILMNKIDSEYHIDLTDDCYFEDSFNIKKIYKEEEVDSLEDIYMYCLKNDISINKESLSKEGLFVGGNKQMLIDRKLNGKFIDKDNDKFEEENKKLFKVFLNWKELCEGNVNVMASSIEEARKMVDENIENYKKYILYMGSAVSKENYDIEILDIKNAQADEKEDNLEDME